MTLSTIPIPVSEALYQRLERFAQLTNKSLEAVIEQTLQAGIPSLPENIAPEMKDDLLTLETLDDDTLWEVARGLVNANQQATLSALLAKNKAGALTPDEQNELATLQSQADQVMLRKAYAFILLKWRGHRLPTLDELRGASMNSGYISAELKHLVRQDTRH
ncbi:MAG: hypothetical protein AAF485_02470 [Chloroflexota bacterium]